MAEPAPSSLPAGVPRELDLLGHIRQTIGVLRGGWRLIGISVLICLIVSIIYLARTKQIYQAGVRLLVLQQGGRPLNVANTDPNRLMEGIEDYIPTHSLIISSPLVIKRAIDKVGLENLPSLLDVKKEGGDPVEAAIKHLKVTRPDRLAKVLRVEYQAGDRDEAVWTIEAIIDSYKQFLEETFQKNSSTVISLISRARDDLDKELGELEAKYLELRRKTPGLITGKEGHSSLPANRLANWDREVSVAMVKAVQLEAQLELARKLAREGTELWAVVHAISQLGGDTSSLMAALASGTAQSGAADYIRQLSQQQQQLAEQFGPEYAKVRELQAQIDRIRGRVRGARSRLEGDEVRDLLNAIDQSFQSVQAMRSELGKQFDQEQEKAKQFEEDLLAEADLRGKLERQRVLFNTVVDQLKQAQFVSDYSSITAQVIEPAKTPHGPVWPKVSLTLALALVVGCAVGMGAAVVSDRLDQRVRSLDELRQLTDLAVLGQVALLPKDQSAATGSIGLISHAKPRSSWAEAYRAIRTNLDFLRRRNQRLQVLLVTSTHPGDGKTTSTSNLAISFALAGRRVLLIDADLRRPSLHKVHGLGCDHGLTQLLKELLPLDRAVQRSKIENLDVITAGPEVPNPAELLSSSHLAELLDEARQAYDVILLDSPPLLAVADPAIVGAVVDGVVLVTLPMTVRRDIEHVMELLRSLGTSLLGMLVNGVSREDRGYGYGYGYGYGSYGRSTERRSGDATSPIGAEDQAPETVTQANGQPGLGLHEESD
jgi:polysaccharide biosynthesis transport protein